MKNKQNGSPRKKKSSVPYTNVTKLKEIVEAKSGMKQVEKQKR